MRDCGGHAIYEKHEATGLLETAVATLRTDPNNGEALVNLCHALNVLERDLEALAYSEHTVKVFDHPYAWFNLGLMYRQFGRYEEAFPWVEKARNAIPDDPFMGHVYAEELIRQERWLEAWPLCSKYRVSKAWIAPRGLAEWKGQDLQGKRIIVISEGGRGDAFWLFRFMPLLEQMGTTVTFSTWEDVGEFLSHHIWINKPEGEIFFDKEHPYDYWVSVFELLQWLKVDKPYWQGPYLQVKTEMPIEWPAGFGSKPKVGLCWSCGEMLDVRKHRSMAEAQAATLFADTRLDWVNLQKDVKAPGGDPFEPPLRSWQETATIIDKLDLVITVDTAMVHLAGAMGKPTWLVIGGYRDCKWGAGTRSGWYPSVRIFHVPGHAGFDKVVDSVHNSLDTYLSEVVEQTI